MRRPYSFQQGDLDGLCGAYSVINAISWGLHSLRVHHGHSRPYRSLREHERDNLFRALLEAVITSRSRSRIVVDGLHSLDLVHMLRVASTWLSQERVIRLRYSRPLYHHRRVRPVRMMRILTTCLARPGTAVILGVESPWKHWTVVTSVASRCLLLLDSGGYSQLVLCPVGNQHVSKVKPSSVFLVELADTA